VYYGMLNHCRFAHHRIYSQVAYGPWAMACKRQNFNGLLFQI